MRGTPRERLDAKWVEAESGCWEWTAHITSSGYAGIFWLDGEGMQGHRASYIINVGPIPPGYDIDHLCRNRRCVNPDHLEAVTRRENLRRRKPYWVAGRNKIVTP